VPDCVKCCARRPKAVALARRLKECGGDLLSAGYGRWA
jgi:hypothetical protein